MISKEAMKLQKEGIPLRKAINMAGLNESRKKNNPKPMGYSKPMKKKSGY